MVDELTEFGPRPKNMVDELAEFQLYHDLVRKIERLMRAALGELDDRDHDILLLDYGLHNFGFNLRNPERASYRYPSYQLARDIGRARRHLFNAIDRLVENMPGPPPLEVRQTIALLRGEDLDSLVLDPRSPVPLVRPAESSIISAERYKQGLIEVPVNTRIIDFFAQNPDYLHLMPPREFERLIAEALKSFGYLVRLGPLGRDGGVDIYAEKELALGTELVLVQCKRYDPKRKVSEPVIKQLYADVADRQATRGLVVTSSYFTSTALKYMEIHKYRLGGADRDRLLGWLESLRASGRSRDFAPNPTAATDRKAPLSGR